MSLARPVPPGLLSAHTRPQNVSPVGQVSPNKRATPPPAEPLDEAVHAQDSRARFQLGPWFRALGFVAVKVFRSVLVQTFTLRCKVPLFLFLRGTFCW